MRAIVIGDHRHALVQRIFIVVEREHGLARLRLARHQTAIELGDIIDMQWPPMVQHHIIGNIHQRVDRLLSGRFQPRLHPVR